MDSARLHRDLAIYLRACKAGPVLRLDGKVVFISGVGSIGPGWGNGKATATLLARQGATVFGVDLSLEAAEQTRGIIEGEGGRCAVRRTDMTVSQEVADAVAHCVDRFGGIDILVNNVGGSAPGGPATMTEAEWDAQVDFNLKTCFLGCHHAVPVMLEAGSGVIVNLSSVAGIRQHLGRPQAAYSATKAAVVELSRAVAIQHARDGIRCNAVLPGLMHTPLVEARLAHQIAGGDVDALVAARHEKVPIGRMGDAWDVAHAILFLVSDEASYITAEALVVDGGYSAATP
jgi:NAD(P)-dependent dehydrogenase (short-subunit alcohol dehydrogenase family)